MKYTYYCIGCNKICCSDQFYEHGYICCKCRENGVKLKVNCIDCGKIVEINFSYYKDTRNNPKWRCKDCYKKFMSLNQSAYIANLSPEEQKNRMIPALQGNTLWRNNRTEDEYNKWRENISKGDIEYFLTETNEQKEIRLTNSSDAQQKRYKNETEEERNKRIENHILGWEKKPQNEKDLHALLSKEKWDRMSKEEQIKSMISLYDGRAKYYNNLSKEELMKHMQPCLIGGKRWLSNQSKESLQAHTEPAHKGWKKWYDELDYDKIDIIEYKKAIENNEKFNFMVNKNELKNTEFQFLNLLDENKIQYKLFYSNIIKYPKFHEIFPFHPITKSIYISPFHKWDFLLLLNGTNIFVDIDGSVHDISRSKSLNDFTSKVVFNDSQRIYQTDGLDAYIVKCHDNNIYKDDVRVENIKTKEEMTLAEFIDLIKKINYENSIKILNGNYNK